MNDTANCPRCGIRRKVKPERGVPFGCRDCPPEKPWDEEIDPRELDVRWVRDGLVWRAEPVQNALETRGSARDVWDNGGGPAGALTPVDPALDQHTSLEGSASRG